MINQILANNIRIVECNFSYYIVRVCSATQRYAYKNASKLYGDVDEETQTRCTLLHTNPLYESAICIYI